MMMLMNIFKIPKDLAQKRSIFLLFEGSLLAGNQSSATLAHMWREQAGIGNLLRVAWHSFPSKVEQQAQQQSIIAGAEAVSPGDAGQPARCFLAAFAATKRAFLLPSLWLGLHVGAELHVCSACFGLESFKQHPLS
jgi:hypothetical protein